MRLVGDSCKRKSLHQYCKVHRRGCGATYQTMGTCHFRNLNRMMKSWSEFTDKDKMKTWGQGQEKTSQDKRHKCKHRRTYSSMSADWCSTLRVFRDMHSTALIIQLTEQCHSTLNPMLCWLVSGYSHSHHIVGWMSGSWQRTTAVTGLVHRNCVGLLIWNVISFARLQPQLQ